MDQQPQFGLVVNPPMAELFTGGRTPHRGTSAVDGIVSVGYSPRVTPEQILPVLERLPRAGASYARNGSGALSPCHVAAGRLLGYIEPHINPWDCLGAIAVYDQLEEILGGGR